MRIALLFRRPDVDVFLNEIPHDHYVEWARFVAVEPTGWQALQLVTQRLSYHIRQAAAPRARMKESQFSIQMLQPGDAEKIRDAQAEAWGVEQRILAKMKAAEGKNGR